MAPRQVFPYDECGTLRTSRQFLVDGSELATWQQEQQPKEHWLDIPAPDEYNTPPEGDSSIITRGAWDEQQPQPAIDDVHDALNDDDDDDDEDHDDAGSVDLGSNWASREFVPKRGVEIFVGGLTRSTRRDMLRDWFQHAGEVTEVRIARDKRRRRCRGYGYVRFATSEEANRAIDTMHRYEFKHGRFLGVLPSDENRTLFVGGLREEWSCDYICQLLKEKMVSASKRAFRVVTRSERCVRYVVDAFDFGQLHYPARVKARGGWKKEEAGTGCQMERGAGAARGGRGRHSSGMLFFFCVNK